MPRSPQPAAPRTILLAFLAVVAVMWLTCGPLLSRPQLDPDDARYLEIARGLVEDPLGSLPSAFVVENRWDHLWWVDLDGAVRFFRPAVVASYALDAAIAPGSVAAQLISTNLVLHLACCLVFAVLALRWLRPGPAVLAAVLFAAFAAHAEHLWYVAGRTGALATLGVLGTLALHARATPAARAGAVSAFALGLMAKETAAAAPVLCLLGDAWLARRGTIREILRRDRALYLAYGAVLGGYLVVRAAALGGAGASFVAPYLIAPWSAAFPAHLAAQLLSYAQNLAAGTQTAPFADLAAVLAATTAAAVAAVAAVAAALAVAASRSATARFGLVLAAATWLPASVAYLSERYLFLPAAGIALAAGAAAGLPRARDARAVACAVLGAWALHQGVELRARNAYNGVETTRGPARLERTLAPLRPRIPRGATLWLVNLPGGWIDAQFAEPTLRWLFADPALRVRVLTLMPRLPGLGRGVAVTREADGAVFVSASGEPAILDYPKLLPWQPLEPARAIGRPGSGLAVEVVRGGGEFAHALRFRATGEGEEPLVLVWRADPDRSLSPYVRAERARVDLVAR